MESLHLVPTAQLITKGNTATPMMRDSGNSTRGLSASLLPKSSESRGKRLGRSKLSSLKKGRGGVHTKCNLSESVSLRLPEKAEKMKGKLGTWMQYEYVKQIYADRTPWTWERSWLTAEEGYAKEDEGSWKWGHGRYCITKCGNVQQNWIQGSKPFDRRWGKAGNYGEIDTGHSIRYLRFSTFCYAPQ